MDVRGIGVFGSSESLPGEPEYERARRIGRLIAGAGFAVVCGGYGGIMEASSRGAREAGGRAIGITCAEFRSRTANPYLTELHEEPDLFARTRRLIGSSRSFIILPGKSGTLAEAVFLWALRRAGLGEGKPVVLVGDIWPRVLEALRSSKLLEAESLSDTTIAIDEEEAVVKATAERAEAGHGESRTGSDAQG
ncbi:MAG: hypothetical protein DMF49_06390 [Acidobacteria bacterium]|nr:MAG: hypothetical protein DMF49_06390 [Acidobacteriota bacterium]